MAIPVTADQMAKDTNSNSSIINHFFGKYLKFVMKKTTNSHILYHQPSVFKVELKKIIPSSSILEM